MIAEVSFSLDGEVTDTDQVLLLQSKPGNTPFWKQPVWLVICGSLLTIIITVLIWQPAPRMDQGPIDSIAVLPFSNEIGDADVNHLCSGIPASISASLSSLKELRVIPTGELMRFREGDSDPQTVAIQLGVRAILQGWLTRIGEELSIRVELIDGNQNRVLWGKHYHLPFIDIFQIEDEISGKVAAALRIHLNAENEVRLSKHSTKDAEAYEAFLKGQFLLAQMENTTQSRAVSFGEDAIGYFQRALETDPDYALAYIGLYSTYYLLGFLETSEEAYSKARNAIEKAIEIDNTLAEAHLGMAAVLAFYDHDWIGSEIEYEMARELGAILSVDYRYPLWLLWLGRFEKALEAVEEQSELADPLSDSQRSSLGYRYYFARRFDQALENAINFGNPYLQVLCYSAKGLDQEVFASMKSNIARNAESDLPQLIQIYRMSGLKAFWKEWTANRMKWDKPCDLAGGYALAGEKDLAFQFLEKAYTLPVHIPFVTDARFDSLRDDPRFAELLRKLNLPEEAIARHLAGYD